MQYSMMHWFGCTVKILLYYRLIAIALKKAQFRGVLETVSRWYERDIRAIVSKYDTVQDG